MPSINPQNKSAANTPKQAFLTFLYTTPWLTRLGLRGLNALCYLIGKIPVLRDVIPITDSRKNNMTYLAVNTNIIDNRPKVIPVNENTGEAVNEILPRQILDDMIDVYTYHFLMDACICRTGFACRNFSKDVGCLFMGETARKLPPGLGGQVSREQAHAHVDKAVGLGLIPMTGKVNVDNLGFLVKDTKELFSVCFCCHCCCMMGYYKHSPDHLKKLFKPIEGLSVRVNQRCTGCKTCLGTCIFDSIVIKNGVAVHLDHCVGCGRCADACPNGAVEISLDNPHYVQDVKNRLQSFVKVS
jgi:UDP-glucose 4-epimerase